MTTTPDRSDLIELNRRHISSIDKLYRMYAGVASKVQEIHDDHFVLQVQVSDGHSPERRETIIFNITKAWLRNSELNHCRRVLVRVVKSQAPAGLCVDPKQHGGIQNKEFITALVEQMRAISAASKLPKILVAEYEGPLPLTTQSDLQRIDPPPTS